MANGAVAALAADSLPDVAMSDALTSTWKAIRRRHPKVPGATVAVAPGRGSACGSVAWDAGMPVILVSAETIAAGPLAILEHLHHSDAAQVRARLRGDMPEVPGSVPPAAAGSAVGGLTQGHAVGA